GKTFALTLLNALERGIEAAYQLDESKLAAELIGDGEHAAVLLYETSEGGSGVLRRIIHSPQAFAEIARGALERTHFDPESGTDQDENCIKACYECLLTYRNQIQVLFIDRRSVRDFLLALTNSHTEMRVGGRSRREHLNWPRSLTDSRSDLERRFLQTLAEGGHRLPDDAQRGIEDPRCVVDFSTSRTCASSAMAASTTSPTSAVRTKPCAPNCGRAAAKWSSFATTETCAGKLPGIRRCSAGRPAGPV
ncbi:MAG: DUF1998 domain-containing protein, partial [Anaerolineae bacterium]